MKSYSGMVQWGVSDNTKHTALQILLANKGTNNEI